MKKGSDTIIERFRSITENPHEYAKSLQAKGQLLAGYMCTHVPEEILYAKKQGYKILDIHSSYPGELAMIGKLSEDILQAILETIPIEFSVIE
jgi:hypothetical protein